MKPETLLYQTHVVVHLDNIQMNIEKIREHIGPDKKVLIAVKANAYGHGAIEVSRLAERAGVDWLGVATVLEGLELRKAGIKLPILKFSPAFPEEMDAAIANRITLSVCDQDNAAALNQAFSRVAKPGERLAVHLKIDTGMGRIGVSPSEAPALALWLTKHCPRLEIEGVFTHLPVSDSPAHNDFTQAQLETFRSAISKIHGVTGIKLKLIHAANSGAVLAHDLNGTNMVRPGIMIYGFYPDETTPRTIPLLPGLSFYSRVSFLKRVKSGTTVGYGRTWKAQEDVWVATVPVGYADGFNRLFSSRGRVLIGGKSYSVVGRVCMDQIMVALGPETSVKVGDQVTLIGRDGNEEITAYEWASALNTITYEVTCQISARVPRVFESKGSRQQ